MSTSAKDMLKKMRKTETKATRKKADPEDFYVKLLIYKQKRRLLSIVLAAFAVFAFVVLTRDAAAGRHWLFTAMPLVGAGFLVALTPITEEWSYRPWQTQSRQYEQHQTEKRA